jgi:lipopolysaccharide transport system permease protein
MKEKDEDWSLVIRPRGKLLSINLRELWSYRDLIRLFVRRDFVSTYKQTVLGPLWFFIQPVISSLTFTVIFGGIAQLPTEGLPSMLFYMSGLISWGYFSECLSRSSGTFTANAGIFGKVYFPRLTVPISGVISIMLKFIIQFLLFLIFLAYYMINGADVNPNWAILLTPVFLILMAGLGLGSGIIISAFTTKYRDFSFLIGFGVQLLMYASSVIYPLSQVTNEKYRLIMMLNPMTPIIEGFRFAYLGAGTLSYPLLMYSAAFTLVTLVAGSLIFTRVERTFMDTV